MKTEAPIIHFLEDLFAKQEKGAGRKESWEKFLSLGIPSKGHEAFQYIPLSTIYASYIVEEENPIEDVSIDYSLHILPESQESVLVFVDGKLRMDLSSLKKVPRQVSISPLTEALKGSYGQFLSRRMRVLSESEEDPFTILNGALFSEGVFVYVPPKIKADVPLQILFLDSGEGSYIGPRVHLALGSSAELHVVNTVRSLSTESRAFHNGFFDITLEENAACYHTCHTEQGFAPVGFMSFRASLKKKALLRSFLTTFGSASLRYDYKVSLLGEESEADLNGICLSGDKDQSHIHVHMDHAAPACRSNQLFKNVLRGCGKASFIGKIYVRRPAQQTEAYQLNKNLLLSDTAIVCSKPNLEIFADDVKASHGCTIAQLDQQQLLYLRTRGVSEKEASALLTRGFCEEIIEKISSKHLKAQVLAEVSRFLAE
jgi:Fe-S cluster assembly protein SufD